MKKIAKLLTIPSMALLLMFLMPSAFASEWDDKTEFTVHETIRIPGAELTPGKYIFELDDSLTNRHIVRVFRLDDDGDREIVTTVLALPEYRVETTDETVITTYETPANQPNALKTWFAPGDQTGHLFAYEDSEARELASASGENIPVAAEKNVDYEMTPKGEEQKIERQASDSRESAVKSTRKSAEMKDSEHRAEAETKAQRRSDEQAMARAEVAQQSDHNTMKKDQAKSEDAQMANAETREETRQSESLPQTGSSLPLVALMGIFSLVGVGILRVLR